MNYFKERQRHAQESIRHLLNHYKKDECKLSINNQYIFLDMIEKNLVTFEAKNYDVRKFRKSYDKIKNDLEGKLE